MESACACVSIDFFRYWCAVKFRQRNLTFEPAPLLLTTHTPQYLRQLTKTCTLCDIEINKTSCINLRLAFAYRNKNYTLTTWLIAQYASRTTQGSYNYTYSSLHLLLKGYTHTHLREFLTRLMKRPINSEIYFSKCVLQDLSRLYLRNFMFFSQLVRYKCSRLPVMSGDTPQVTNVCYSFNNSTMTFCVWSWVNPV